MSALGHFANFQYDSINVIKIRWHSEHMALRKLTDAGGNMTNLADPLPIEDLEHCADNEIDLDDDDNIPLSEFISTC